jgi:hypothetical protein
MHDRVEERLCREGRSRMRRQHEAGRRLHFDLGIVDRRDEFVEVHLGAAEARHRRSADRR